MRIALDAGHGSNTGARANDLVEDEIVFDLVSRIGHHLRANGHDTILTRPHTKLVTIGSRVRTACRSQCDLLLSIHCNAAASAACGAEAFVVRGDDRSRAIALRLVEAVAREGTRSRGVKWDDQGRHSRLGLLRGVHAHMPAVLLEIGFLTSPYDAMLLADPHVRESLAAAVARAVD